MLNRRDCLKLGAAQLLMTSLGCAADRSYIGFPHKKMRFLIFADLHHDLIPDAVARLQAILARAEAEKVEFIIELGDFAMPKAASEPIRAVWDACPIPRYHVLGNHDIDISNKEAYTAFWGIPAANYVFDRGPFRCIVLDSNYYRDASGSVYPYSNGNYYGKPELDVFSEAQLSWVERLLQDRSSHIYLFFSHAPINDQFASISQNRSLHAILTAAQARGVRIAGAFAGHNHSDNFHRIGTMNYFQINSASYIWGGDAFANTQRYPAETYAKYPSLKYTVNYAEALSAIVEVSESGAMSLTGMTGNYLPPPPDENLLKTKPYPCSPIIANQRVMF